MISYRGRRVGDEELEHLRIIRPVIADMLEERRWMIEVNRGDGFGWTFYGCANDEAGASARINALWEARQRWRETR